MQSVERETMGVSERTAAPREEFELRPIADFLSAVGLRVRRQRALVHMSRRQLAERSGVSERYLAQLETGQGNMSIVLLRRVASALEMPLPELVAEEDANAVSERLCDASAKDARLLGNS